LEKQDVCVQLLQELIFDSGAAMGVHLESVAIEGDVASFAGRAPNEASMGQFLERLQAMQRLSAVRLSRAAQDAPQEGDASAIPFTVSARIR
jgi:Tfp pilus assembly protein PilN